MENKDYISSIRKFIAPEFVFGVNSTLFLGRYCKSLDLNKVLIVTDNTLKNTKNMNAVIQSLISESIQFEVFSDITPNPKDIEVMKGAAFFINTKCDSIVAYGGGSVIDAAKGIGIVSTNNQEIVTFEGVDKIELPMPPFICIPTTAGSSADVSQFCIINKVSEKVKIAIISKSLVPDVSLIDPVNLISMPAFLTACTGIDALVHAFEAYVSTGSSYVTDVHALTAVKLITENLIDSITNPDDIERRSLLMMGSLQAGLAFSNASLGCVHALAHSLGWYFDLPHGECNALLLEAVVDYNFSSASKRYSKLAETIGLDVIKKSDEYTKKILLEFLADFRNKAGVRGTLKERGVKDSDIPVLSSKAIHDPCNATNPRIPTISDIENLYRRSL